jgi:hypothetical protein
MGYLRSSGVSTNIKIVKDVRNKDIPLLLKSFSIGASPFMRGGGAVRFSFFNVVSRMLVAMVSVKKLRLLWYTQQKKA